MNFLNAKRWISLVMFAVAMLCTALGQAATPASWKDSGFSINADGMTLHDMFNEFGLAYGVRVSISIKDNIVLRGRLKAETGTDFLERLTHTYKFRWFVYNDTLYIVPRTENTSMRLEVGEDAVQDAKAALVGLGLFDSRFGWGELPDEGTVMVSGPREYVNLVRDVLLPDELPREGKKTALKGKQLMVFRLKYASATDRVINTRGQKETIPGIKTILNGLLNPESGDKLTNGTSSGRDKFDVASEKHSRQGKNGKGRASEMGGTSGIASSQNQRDSDGDNEHAAKSKNDVHDSRARIDADSSINAIIIYDTGSKRSTYQALIDELDVEPQQVEIEALIVDIDRSKLGEMGVEWGVQRGNTRTTVNGTASDSQGLGLPLPGSTLLISNLARFYARLKAMEGTGDAHVLAKPTVLTLDNVAAVLDLSQTAYVPLVGERVADLANITAGTMLRVVPRIVREGANVRVRLEIDIEDGTLGDPGAKTTVTRSTISTQAIVDIQQTLMIGGYHSESISKNQQKVPLLGDVPLFGGLFRSNTESQVDRERLFLITPRLSGTGGVPASVRSKAAGSANKFLVAHNQRMAMEQNEAATAANAVSEQAAPNFAAAPLETAQPPRRKLKCARPHAGA